MSDTEAQNKTEEVKMDAPAQEETTEAAPAVETKEVKEDAPAAAESSNAAEEKTNGDDKEAEKMEVEANGQEEAAADETKEEDAPAPKKPKSKTAGPSSRRNGAKAAPSDNATFKTGDVVLARVKGYPFWPAMIIDGDDISADVMKAKPSGSQKIHCARFFPDATHAWCTSKDLQPLKAHEITAFLQSGNKKKGDLHKAYQLAEDPTDWINSLNTGDAMEDGEDEDQLADEVDEEPVEDAGKKRKRGGEKKPADTKAKKAKLEKLAKSKKSKDTVEDDEEEEEAPKPVSKKAASKPKSKKEVKEPEAAEEEDASDPLANDPEAKKVKDWRHKLQRGFLGKSTPTEEEMPQYDELFTAIESYEGMTVDYLAHSKIGKVMKKIAALDNIARNDELKITERASQMMQKWHAQVEQPRSE